MELEYFVLQINEGVKTFVMIGIMISDKKIINYLLKNKCQNVAPIEQNRNLWSIALIIDHCITLRMRGHNFRLPETELQELEKLVCEPVTISVCWVNIFVYMLLYSEWLPWKNKRFPYLPTYLFSSYDLHHSWWNSISLYCRNQSYRNIYLFANI